jgi:hypothetical protein
MLKIIQYISFFGLAIVSTGLGIILYTGLSHDLLSFLIMFVVAGVIEAIKIYCLTLSNTAFWQALQLKNRYIDEFIKGMFKPQNLKKIKDGKLLKTVESYLKHRRQGRTRFIIYLFAAFLSVSASYGYISQSVYLTTQAKVSVSTSEAQSIYSEKIKAIDDRIAQDKKLNAEYAKDQGLLDSQNDADFQKKYDNYQKKIDKNNDDIQKQLDLKQGSNETLQGLKLGDIKTNSTKGKTMYILMGESLGLSDRTVMFILLYLLAIMIEVGLFITSPHFNQMDAEDIEEEKIIPLSTEKKKTNGKVESLDKEIEEYKEKIEKAIEIPDDYLAPFPKPEEIAESFEKEKKESTQYIEPIYAESFNIEPKPEFEGMEEEIEKFSQLNPPQEKQIAVSPIDVPQEPPLVRKIIDRDKLIDAFIDNLFDEKGRMLKKEDVAIKVGLPLFHAIKIVDFLTHSTMVQFRPPVSFYKVASMEEIKRAMGQLYKGEK